jgi:hypothetical protein
LNLAIVILLFVLLIFLVSREKGPKGERPRRGEGGWSNEEQEWASRRSGGREREGLLKETNEMKAGMGDGEDDEIKSPGTAFFFFSYKE